METERAGEDESCVCVSFCASAEYLDLVQVALWSMLLSRREDRRYRIYILSLDVPDGSKKRFLQEMSGWKGLEIIFLDVSELVRRYAPDANIPVKETMLSLLLPELLPEEKRILSLDSDVIVQRDLGELYDEDIEGTFLAAALDPDFIGQYNGGNHFYRRYYKNIVPLSRPYEYFQGGVYVLNLEELRGNFLPGELFREAVKGQFRYDDQDVLNLRCAGKIKELDMRWNVLYDSLGYRRRYVVALAPAYIREMYDKARDDPWIIHFAGGERPWRDENCDFGGAFWAAADQTPAGERLRAQLERFQRSEGKTTLDGLARKCWRYLRYKVRKLRVNMKEKFHEYNQKI